MSLNDNNDTKLKNRDMIMLIIEKRKNDHKCGKIYKTTYNNPCST